jgi:hypothetical protein
MSAADDQTPYDFIAWTGTRDNFMFVFVSLGNAAMYEPEMMQLSYHIIQYIKELLVVLFTSMVLEHISISNICDKGKR